MPVVFRHHPDAYRKSSEKNRREIVDRELTDLDHETEDARERPALGASKPGRVHFDHARGTERLEVTVHQPDCREGGERPGERGESEDEVDEDRARGADEHRDFAADAISEKAVDQLAGAVGDGPGAEHAGDLECAKSELRHHSGSREPEIVPAHVERGVEQADDEPVQSPSRTKPFGILCDREFRHFPKHVGRCPNPPMKKRAWQLRFSRRARRVNEK